MAGRAGGPAVVRGGTDSGRRPAPWRRNQAETLEGIIHERSGIRPETWQAFFEGSRLACARLISAVDNRPEWIPDILDRLIPCQKGAVRIGVTGPPGVGKSTVTAALARRAVQAGHSAGIIAVDPSSPFSGGAFLGDRIRMQSLGDDDRIFIRSLASREGHGGLSPAAPYAADVLDAFGMDRIFIETVGVGQAELDVLTCADIILLVLQPVTGDIIQTLKAGIIEIADMFFVNKADLPGSDAVLESLKFLFEISAPRIDKPVPPVAAVSALRDEGVDEAYAGLEALIESLIRSGRHAEKKRDRLEREIASAVRENLWRRYADASRAPAEIRAAAERLLRDRRSPFPYIRDLCARVDIHLREERAKGENAD